MSDERRPIPPNVYMEPVHTNGMVIYGYSNSPNPQFNQQYGPPNPQYSQQYGPPNTSQQYSPHNMSQQYSPHNTGQHYSPRPHHHSGNYSRTYSTPPPPIPNDILFRYKPTIAEYYAKYYTPHSQRPQFYEYFES